MNQLAILAAEEIERTLFMVESEYHNKIMKSESYFSEDTAEIIDRVCFRPQKEAVRELVEACKDFEEVVNRNWECTEWDNLRAALARVIEGEKK
jgi:hypothetical protein